MDFSNFGIVTLFLKMIMLFKKKITLNFQLDIAEKKLYGKK